MIKKYVSLFLLYAFAFLLHFNLKSIVTTLNANSKPPKIDKNVKKLTEII